VRIWRRKVKSSDFFQIWWIFCEPRDFCREACGRTGSFRLSWITGQLLLTAWNYSQIGTVHWIGISFSNVECKSLALKNIQTDVNFIFEKYLTVEDSSGFHGWARVNLFVLGSFSLARVTKQFIVCFALF